MLKKKNRSAIRSHFEKVNDLLSKAIPIAKGLECLPYQEMEQIVEDLLHLAEKEGSPTPQDMVDSVKKMLAKAEGQGYLTYQEINETLSDEIIRSEEIDRLLILFEATNIFVIADSIVETFKYKRDSLQVQKATRIICPDVSSELIEYFRQHPSHLKSMPPRKFEELVAAIFKNQGFYVELTPEVRDGGFDLIAIRNDAITGRNVHLVECKRYKPENRVGVGVVRGLLGVVEHRRATKGHIVTTSFFTEGARDFARTFSARLSLSDLSVLIRWLRSLPLGNEATIDS